MSGQESSGVQATLRRVIELGHYGAAVLDDERQTYVRSPYMCAALGLARTSGEITEDEHEHVAEDIMAYLAGVSVSMYRRLRLAGVVPPMELDEFADTAGRQLYWDWDKRQPLD